MTADKGKRPTLDDWLEEEGIREEVDAVARKRGIAWELGREMEAKGITKTEMARRIETSRSQLDRVLGPYNYDVRLGTLERIAHALGKHLNVELVDEDPGVRDPEPV